MRLDRFLRERGIPRRESRELLTAGRITVNDAPAQALGQDCGSEDRILVDGAAVGPVQLRYVMLNKPAGYVTAVSDPEPCVMDLLPEQFRTWGLFPVGRLDKASEGLLLLTNDGGLCQRILSPAEHLPKRYFIAVDRPFPPETGGNSGQSGRSPAPCTRGCGSGTVRVRPPRAFRTVRSGR